MYIYIYYTYIYVNRYILYLHIIYLSPRYGVLASPSPPRFLLLPLLILLLLVVHRQALQHGIDTMRLAHRLPPRLAQAIA